MLAVEEIIKILEYSEKYTIIDVHVMPGGFIRGCLLNDVDPRRPYRLIVDPQKQSMRIWFTSVVKTQNRAVSKALDRIRPSLSCADVGIDPRGAVSFRYEQDNDLLPAKLVILLDKMFASIQLFEMTVTFYTMLDSRIPRNFVKKIMKRYFPEWKKKPTSLHGDTLYE